jgi:hypothetical protein
MTHPRISKTVENLVHGDTSRKYLHVLDDLIDAYKPYSGSNILTPLEEFANLDNLTELSTKFVSFCGDVRIVLNFIELAELLYDINPEVVLSSTITENLLLMFGKFPENNEIILSLLDFMVTGIDFDLITAKCQVIREACHTCLRYFTTTDCAELILCFRFTTSCLKKTKLDSTIIVEFLESVSESYAQMEQSAKFSNYLVEFVSVLCQHDYSFPSNFNNILGTALNYTIRMNKFEKLPTILQRIADDHLITSIRNALQPQDLSVLMILARNSKFTDESRNSFYMHYHPRLQHVRIKPITNWNTYAQMCEAMIRIVNRNLVQTCDSLEREALSILTRQYTDIRINSVATKTLLDLLLTINNFNPGAIIARANDLVAVYLVWNYIDYSNRPLIVHLLEFTLALSKSNLTKHDYRQQCNEIVDMLQNVKPEYMNDTQIMNLVRGIEDCIFTMFVNKFPFTRYQDTCITCG